MFLLINFFLFSNYGYSQSKPVFNNQGFVVLESSSKLSQEEINKIEETNFDEYRFYNLRKKIQLIRGPLLELLSIKELEAKGQVFSKDLVDTIKLRSENFKHESIATIDLGLGIIYINKPE